MTEKEIKLKKLPGKKKPPTLTLKIAPAVNTAAAKKPAAVKNITAEKK